MANLDQVERLLPPPSSRFVGYALGERVFWQRVLRGRASRVLGRAFHASAAILAFLTFWEIAPRIGLAEPAFLPPLSTVLASGWELVRNGQLANHVQASLSRSLVGFAMAIGHAVPLGLAIGWYRRFASVVNPLLEALRNTAALALLPVFILVLGIGESSKIALVVYSCSWPILLNTITAVRNVDPLLIKSARTMGLSSFQLFRKRVRCCEPSWTSSAQDRWPRGCLLGSIMKDSRPTAGKCLRNNSYRRSRTRANPLHQPLSTKITTEARSTNSFQMSA